MRPIKQRAPVGRPSKTKTGVADTSEGDASRRLYVTPRPEVEMVCGQALLTYLRGVDPSIGKLAGAIIPVQSDQARCTSGARRDLWLSLENLLTTLRVIDPACGEGHMLRGMLDLLDHVGRILGDRLGRCETAASRRARIVQHNLFGVEAQRERVEICRAGLLSEAGSRTALGAANAILVGDSLVERPRLQREPRFDAIFRDGGFHLAVGNPPYVRHERIRDPLRQMEPELYKSRAFEEANGSMRRSWADGNGGDTCSLDGRSDLSLLFTFKGLSLLRPDGVLCFVLPTALFAARYGHSLDASLQRSQRHAEFIENVERRSFSGVGVNTGILVVGPRRVGMIPGFHRCEEHKNQIERSFPKASAPQIHAVLDTALPASLHRRQFENQLVPLGTLGDVRYPVKTGLNRFFYPDAAVRSRFGIERRFLQPVVRSPRDVEAIHMRAVDLATRLFVCPYSEEQLRQPGSEGAAAYISWATRQVAMPRGKGESVPWPSVPSLAGRKLWYSVTVPGEAHLLFPRFLFRRFFIAVPPPGTTEDQTFYGLVLACGKAGERALIAALLNSSLTYFMMEMNGRTGLGDGIRQYALRDVSTLPVPNPDLVHQNFVQPIVSSFSALAARKILPIEEEIRQDDRKHLDDLVCEGLGLPPRIAAEARDSVVALTTRRIRRATQR